MLSGIAWSGRGTIARVDVSLDGGRNWTTAPRRAATPMSMTRFYLDFDWAGQEARWCSPAPWTTPAMSSPPSRSLRAIRGTNSIYHNNGIQTWLVRSNGETENVEVG